MRTIITTTGISLLTNTARDLKKKNSEVTDAELRQYFTKVGAVEASAETNSLLKIATPDDEEIIGGNFENTTLKRVKKVFDDGDIRVLWADNEKAANITIRTTARGQTQTLKFCDRYIRPLLNS